MRFPLIWRILAPTLAVSMLLLGVGLAAAIYAYRWNDRVSLLLDNRVTAVLSTQELVLAIRDTRHALSRYDVTKDREYINLAKSSIADAHKLLPRVSAFSSPEDSDDLERLRETIAQTQVGIDQLIASQDVNSDTLRRSISVGELATAQELLDRRQAAVSEESRQNRMNADRIGMSLAILGLCGAGAGLLAGFGVARGITRSIEQLGGSVHSMAETIFQNGEASLPPPTGIHELLATIGDIRQKTVGIMDELEQSREKATRSDQLSAVGQLAAGIAHELRNPLTAVKLLVDDAVEQNTPLRGAELQVLQDEVEHMEQMTQMFLDFARPPKLIRQSFDLKQVVEQCLELVRRRCEMLHIAIDFQAEPISVMGDFQQLRQVVLNLLLNAIDAQPDGGRIEVKLAEDFDAGACHIEIADEGSGISDEYRDRIFDPFVSTKETGMGLGLAISRRIVRSHGGEITTAKQANRGTIFRIDLPLSEVPEGAARV
jgi:signal transduction histidine kinase